MSREVVSVHRVSRDDETGVSELDGGEKGCPEVAFVFIS